MSQDFARRLGWVTFTGFLLSCPACMSTHRPAWSRDSRRVVFPVLSPSGGGGSVCKKLVLVDLSGERVRDVATVPAKPEGYLSPPSWSPDGKWIAYQSAVAEGDGGVLKLFIQDAETGAERCLLTTETKMTDWMDSALSVLSLGGGPQWLSDSSAVAGRGAPEREAEGFAMLVVDLNGEVRKRIPLPEYAYEAYLSPDGRFVAYRQRGESEGKGFRRPRRVTRPKKRADNGANDTSVGPGPEKPDAPQKRDEPPKPKAPEPPCWLLDVETGVRRELIPPSEGVGDLWAGTWSPDSRFLYFVTHDEEAAFLKRVEVETGASQVTKIGRVGVLDITIGAVAGPRLPRAVALCVSGALILVGGLLVWRKRGSRVGVVVAGLGLACLALALVLTVWRSARQPTIAAPYVLKAKDDKAMGVGLIDPADGSITPLHASAKYLVGGASISPDGEWVALVLVGENGEKEAAACVGAFVSCDGAAFRCFPLGGRVTEEMIAGIKDERRKLLPVVREHLSKQAEDQNGPEEREGASEE